MHHPPSTRLFCVVLGEERRSSTIDREKGGERERRRERDTEIDREKERETPLALASCSSFEAAL